MITIHGGALSPFVRKTRAFCLEKGIPFETTALSPIPKTPELLAMNPIGKIPVLEDDGAFIPDSSVICAYLERVHPHPQLVPTEAKAFARVLFFEEFADTKGVEAFSPALFERVIKKQFFQQDADEDRLTQVREELAPPVLDYLESRVGDGDGVVDDRFTLADCALGAQLQNWALAGEEIDAGRWPNVRAYSDSVLSRPSFKTLAAEVSG